jgi:hypothetical protein
MGQESNALSSKDYESHVLLLNYKPELAIILPSILRFCKMIRLKKVPLPMSKREGGWLQET